MKINYMKRMNGAFEWRQIEVKNGRVFMRMNKSRI